MSKVIDAEIGIDCPPGAPRPSEYILGVVEDYPDIAKQLKPEGTTSRVFGAWTWEFKVSEKVWKEAYDNIHAKLTNLYSGGAIRGAVIGPTP